MPPKHRPVEPLPRSLEFLARSWWLPVVLFWAFTLGIVWLAWLLRG